MYFNETTGVTTLMGCNLSRANSPTSQNVFVNIPPNYEDFEMTTDPTTVLASKEWHHPANQQGIVELVARLMSSNLRVF